MTGSRPLEAPGTTSADPHPGRGAPPPAAPTDTETRLRLAIESTRAGTHERDLLTDEATWSARLREIYDIPDGETPTTGTWLSRIHRDDRERVLQAQRAALDPAGPGHYRVTFRVVRRDRSVRWVEGNGQIAFETLCGVRTPVRLAGLTFDVTDRIETLAALHDSEERLQLAMRSAALGVFDWDILRDALQWSPETRRMFGIGPDESLSVEIAIGRVHPDDRGAMRAGVAQALDPRGDGAYRMRFRVVWPDGALRWLDASGQVRFDPGSAETRRAERFCGVVADVTDTHLALETLRDADRRKDEFLAMLAHELRNPLAPLVNAHEVLSRSATFTEPQRTALAIARRQASQLGRLVDDLLEVSRITRGMIALRLEPMGLGSAVYESAEAVAPAIEARRQSLVVKVPSRPLRIVADAARIAQVLENLLNNASKFTPEGGTIRVEVESCGEEVELRVVDTGVGIAPGQLGAIFDLFAQAHPTPDRAQGGLGIGLALVRRLVALHGGWVGAASAGPGQGATFTVRLPRSGPGG